MNPNELDAAFEAFAAQVDSLGPSGERAETIRRHGQRVLVAPPSRVARTESAVALVFSALMLGWAVASVAA